jgi:pimeloyl-ACP methyl ester carboxylesterase
LPSAHGKGQTNARRTKINCSSLRFDGYIAVAPHSIYMNKTFLYKNKELHYRVEGNGMPVVLLHGFGEDSKVWDTVMPALKDQFMLLVPDLPGSGRSPMLEGEVSMESLAESVYHLVLEEIPAAKTEKKQIVMVGHSMGGYITLAFAEKYGSMLRAFGLFHSSAFADPEEKKEARKKSIRFVEQHGAAKFIEQATPNLFSDAFKEKHPEIVEDITARYTNFSEKSIVSYYEAMIRRPDRTAILKQFSGPILFIMGQHDNAIPLKDILLQCHMPGLSYLQLLSESGHMGMIEEPERSNSFLRKFLVEIEMDTAG